MASPHDDWVFSHWLGADIGTEQSNPLEVVVTNDINITAVFVPLLSLDLTIDGQGHIEISPDEPRYAQGTSVELTAIPDAGWRFVRWELDEEGLSPHLTVLMDNNKSIRAVFEQERYMLEVATDGQGIVEVTPQQEHYYWGSEVLLQARPIEGWYLAKWSDLPATTLSRTLTMTGDTSITAVFRPIADGFITRFYSSIIIGSVAHQTCFSITNILPFGVGLSKVEILDHNGNIRSQTSDPELLCNNYLSPGSSVSLQIDFRAFPPYVSELSGWEVHWHIEVDGTENIIRSFY
jgi:NOL1/NOP2/fmu family ribosome biogenesis protein